MEHLLTIEDAAARVGLDPRTIRRLIDRGQLRSVRLAGVRALRVPEGALAELVVDGRRPSGAAEPAPVV